MSEEVTTTEAVATETNLLAGAAAVAKPEYIPEKFWDADSKQPNIEGLAKSYKELESRLGSTRATIPDFEKASPEEVKGFWKSVGAGESVEDYAIAAPEGVSVDEGFVKEFQEFALENSIPKSMYNKLTEWYMTKQAALEGNVRANTEAWNKQQEENKAALKSEWGSNYQKNIDGSWNALTSLVGEPEARKMLDKYGNDTTFLKMMNNIHHKISEDSISSEHTTSMNKSKPVVELRDEYQKLKNSPDFWNVKSPNRENVINRITELQKMDIWNG